MFKKILTSDFIDLLRHVKNYTISTFFSQSISVLTIPIFTRILEPTDYGILSLYSTFISIFGIIYGLGIRSAVVRFYYDGKHGYKKFLGNALTIYLIWTINISLVLMVYMKPVSIFFQLPIAVVGYGLATVFFQEVFVLYESYLQALKKSQTVSLVSIIRRVAVVSISVLLIICYNDEKYYGKIHAILITMVILSIWSAGNLFKIARINFNREQTILTLKYSIPILAHLLGHTVIALSDRIVIGYYVGAKEVGLYSFAYSIGMIQQLFGRGIILAWTPTFYEYMKNREYNKVEDILVKITALNILFCSGLVLFTKEIAIVFAKSNYHEALDIVPVILISYLFFFVYSIYSNYAAYAKKTISISAITLLVAALNILLNLILVPRLGYLVASMTTLATYFLLALANYLNAKRFSITFNIISFSKIYKQMYCIIPVFSVYYILTLQNTLNGYILLIIKFLTLLIIGYGYIYKFRK